MRVGSSRHHHKRLSGTRSHDRRTFSLMVHGPEFGAGEEVVVNPELFPDVKVGDLLEISQPERDHHRLILQVTTLNPVRGKLQVRTTVVVYFLNCWENAKDLMGCLYGLRSAS